MPTRRFQTFRANQLNPLRHPTRHPPIVPCLQYPALVSTRAYFEHSSVRSTRGPKCPHGLPRWAVVASADGSGVLLLVGFGLIRQSGWSRRVLACAHRWRPAHLRGLVPSQCAGPVRHQVQWWSFPLRFVPVPLPVAGHHVVGGCDARPRNRYLVPEVGRHHGLLPDSAPGHPMDRMATELRWLWNGAGFPLEILRPSILCGPNRVSLDIAPFLLRTPTWVRG